LLVLLLLVGPAPPIPVAVFVGKPITKPTPTVAVCSWAAVQACNRHVLLLLLLLLLLLPACLRVHAAMHSAHALLLLLLLVATCSA
jgi:hypothetical protein